MATNHKLVSQMEALGFSVQPPSAEKRKTIVRGDLSAILGLMRDREKLSFAREENRQSVLEYFGPSNSSWRGGTTQDLMDNIQGKIDMSEFIETRNQLDKTALMRTIKTQMLAAKPTRKRRFSEHDGEWEFDRQWEIKPFQSTFREPSKMKAVTIAANFSLSGGESAANITSYGAICWALSDLIESAGVQTRVILSLPNGGTSNTSGFVDCEVELKKPGQYMAPSLLAAGFQSNFYRRPSFALWAACGDLSGGEVYGGLGSCIQWEKRISFEEGILRVSPAIRGGIFAASTDDLQAELAKAVGLQSA